MIVLLWRDSDYCVCVFVVEVLCVENEIVWVECVCVLFVESLLILVF